MACLASFAYSNETIELDSISVTATKIERATKDVTQSISVVNQEEIDDKNIINISEAINTVPGVNVESSTNSSSPRLIIRGAGLKARYGVREIMIVKDGVPMTDPDAFTRFDFIDMQDVKSIEVQKGPGSIQAVNAIGGVIQLISKSVFDVDQNRIKVGVGTYGASQSNIRYGTAIDDNNYMSLNFSSTRNDNDWRENNDIDSKQLSLKYGHIFEDDSTFESEVAYTESNMQLPTSMTQAEFDEFKRTGKQKNTSSAWQNSARDSKILFVNARYEKVVGDITYKPRFYFNTWEHFHPVTSMINDSDDNNVFGTDLELNYNHNLFGKESILVAGVTAKQDIQKGSKKYAYKDYTIVGGGKFNIAKTLSDEKGDLANVEDAKATLYGVYFQESINANEKTLVDVSLRVDKVKFDVDGNEILEYNWSGFGGTTYKTGDGLYSIDEDYTLVSPKLGVSYALSDTTSLYTSIASANQAPTDNELKTNRVENKGTLDKTQSTNYEVGVKTRTKDFAYDIAIYQNDIKDEITAVKQGFTTHYENAGKTQKRGLEFSGTYRLNKSITFGASYAFSDFKFKEFKEEGTTDRSGNHLPYIPRHQYSLNAMFKNKGFKSRVQFRTWGSYYMDNANTQKYSGYDFVTDVMVGYEKQNHNIQLNVNNVFDKHYAMSAQKDLDGDITYKAAAPRTAMLTYTYKF